MMNDYSFSRYPIGQGKHSKVYKVRKRKTIEYYAIKRVDKSQRSEVLQEVRMLSNLNHPNILNFYSWYETSAHFWLVLEYCVGGDLLNLLKQDKQLPEDSIHDFARDMVKALQFLHSKGIIYCDLKPSNVLLDENGCMKLCHFGLARKLHDIETNPLSTLPQSKRGTPCYMAPELFQEGGVHSFASDFWALGCVLYECYTGNPPFVGSEFTQLVKCMLLDPLPPLPGNASDSFVNLVNGLLKKDPAERIQWPELCGHSFWRTKFVHASPLPSQPAFTNMLQIFARPFLSDWNGNRPSNTKTTPPKSREKRVNGVLKNDENNAPQSKVSGTSTKLAQSSRKAHNTKVATGSGEDRNRKATYAKHANILRLSRIAKLNLQRHNRKQNYRLAQQANENDTEVKIENNDMELDFSETFEDDATDDDNDYLICINNGDELPSDIAEDRSEVVDLHLKNTNIFPNNDTVMLEDVKKFESCSEAVDEVAAAILPDFFPQEKVQQDKTTTRKGRETGSDSTKSSQSLSEIFWHTSDLAVKPVVTTRKADKVSNAIPNLPYAIPTNDYIKLPRDELNVLNKKIIDSLSESPSTSAKQNALRYVEILSGNTDAANIITNSGIMPLLVKMLRLSKAASTLRIRLAALVGLLIRHSTVIEAGLANFGIINALVDGLRDRDERVRRYSMAALGELLFYISSLSEHMVETTVLKSPVKENSTSGWQVSNSVIALVSSVLRKGGDDLTQLYALKAIDNICSQGEAWATRFAGPDVLGNLCYIYKAAGKQEKARGVAGSCLVRLARFNTLSIQVVFDKLSFRDCVSVLMKGSPWEKQISLNLLNMAMFNAHLFTNMTKHVHSLFEEKGLVPCLVELIDQGSDALCGKALIFVALLCKTTRRGLPQFLCDSKLLLVVERLATGKDDFVQKCLDAFVQLMTATVPGILEIVAGEIQQMAGRRCHGPLAVLTGGGNQTITTARRCAVILHLLESSLTKHKIVSRQVLSQLANLIKLFETPFKGRDDIQVNLLRIFEAISDESSFIFDDPDIFTSRILPSLAVLYKGNKDGDARFLCLKVLLNTVTVILSYMTASPSVPRFEKAIKDLRSIVQTHFLPLYPVLSEDEDPIPIYAQKLLLMLIEHNFVKVADIMHPETASECFRFLLGEPSNTNLNNVNLCLALASAPEMETRILSQLRVVQEIGNLLDFVYTKEMEDFLEPTLGLCKAFILSGSSKAIAYSSEPALLVLNISFDRSVTVDQQERVKDISDFSSNIGVFLELFRNPNSKVADLASECLVLLLKAAPREATMGLFVNLNKIADMLEFLESGLSSMQLLRVLYGVSFACRQYLSQAMTLAVSTTEIKRIEAFISRFKDATVPGVKEAVLNLNSELQRLPRFV